MESLILLSFSPMRNAVIFLFAAIFAAVVSGSTMSETDSATNTVAELPAITVIASPIAQEEQFTPDGADTVTVGAEQLDRLAAQDLQTALRHIPGVTVSRYSPIGSFGGAQGGSVYVRGTGESRPGGTLGVYQDGVPTMGSFFNHPLLDLNPIDFSESVTITKTPRPRTMSNAFSGIDMTTWRHHENGYGGEAEAVWGRFDSLVTSLKAGVKDGPVDAAGGAYYRSSEGSREHNSSELSGAFARGGMELGENEYLTFIYHRSQSRVEDPGMEGMPTPKYEQFKTWLDSYTIRLESNHDWLRGYSMGYVTDGHLRWKKDHCQEGTPNSPSGSSDTDWIGSGYRGLYDFLWNDWTFSVGLDAMVDEGETKTFNDRMARYTWEPGRQRQTLAAPYIGVRYDFHLDEEWTLSPSLGTKYYFCSDFDDEWAPSAAIDFGKKEYGIFASWQRGIHYPGLIFLANETAWNTLSCVAERMDNFNVGFRGSWEDMLTAHVSLYHNAITDRLDQDAHGLYHNSGELDATGVEATLRYFATDELSFYGGTAIAATQQKVVSRMPRWTWTLGTSWEIIEYVRLDADVNYVDKMYAYTTRSESADDLAEVDRFWTANIRLALDTRVILPVDGEWYVACENVFDRRYEYFPGYEMPGAMLYAGMKIKF